MLVSVQDPTNPTTSPVTGIFASEQQPPAPAGYIGEIDDNDPRIAAFLAKQE